MRSKGFSIKIMEFENQMMIEARLLDSISDTMSNDKQYKKIIKNHDSKEPKDFRIKEPDEITFSEIISKYATLEKDTLIINNSQCIDFQNSFHQIFKTPLDVLENKKRVRIVLDGHIVTFTIKNKSAKAYLQLRSPNENSHPVLFNFLKEAIALFRKEKSNDFLEAAYIFSY